MGLKINRVWQLASADTFSIPEINKVVMRYVNGDLIDGNGGDWIDPFCRNSLVKDICKYTNDLNPDYAGTHNLEALEFLKLWSDQQFDGVLFDPPFSPSQAKEEYQGYGINCTDRSFWQDRKNEAARIIKIGGHAICCGWTSSGIGKKNGFELVEVLLTCHGQQHDTILTVERKQRHV